MDINQKYNLWLTFDDETKKELESVTDKKEIEDRFYKDLEFGTGGLRGIMGAGTNRMNSYTVGKASLGFAKYLKDKYDGEISVAIACDSRLNSRAFEWDSARVFASQGIKVYAYTQIVPVPMLSFATRYLHCNAGVMITASHNPKEYNGYKAYDNTGCQLCTDDAKEVLSYINAIDDYSSVYNDVKTVDEYISDGMIVGVYDELFDEFIKAVKTQSLYNEHSELKIVYTPLHGTGNVPVRKVLEDKIVYVVKEQEEPNGNFPTVLSPNPEDRKALTLGIELAKEKDADIVLGTDPDCDRVGVAVKHNGEYVLLTGNQTGALLVNFVLTMKKDSLNSKSTLVKTIVTSELGANIGRSFGLQVEETLTGFKYIGDKINKFETSGEQEFVIGYEESYGYLVGTHARDKDGVVSSMLVCEMAAWYKNQGKTLVDGLNEIYDKYGYYLDFLDNFVLKGKEGAEKIQNLMVEFRNKGKELLPDIKEIVDFKDGIRDLPKENVLKYIFNDGSWMAVRPSGTEPKIKVYYSIVDPDKSKAKARLENIRQTISSIINA
ncbi:phospho-sugar mutase [Eubacterium coprostanoligenes]|uniref:phospho-sugar mutase n=1 Tax=Eubacterium coprostanoligenes TaxID=290054 RepID=UPI002355F369|nr:phospho-sugar mutase [Eubacterium coprostanoligenes]MCI6254132.1 phospho-sugar mutase [Eubacterium coprostanoligenes]MDY5399562.1 phospho-sugar mutase [Eubacterium coprostanoligenes]